MNEPQIASGHDRFELMLPWYVNGSLTATEQGDVAAHLDRCAACRDAVALLRRMRTAVRHPTATPIVPEPRPHALLHALEQISPRRRALRYGSLLAAAAIVAAVAFLGVRSFAPGIDEQQDFRTLSSESRVPQADYVLEIELAPGAGAREVTQVTELVGGRGAQQSGENRYRLTVTLQSGSLADLEAIATRVEAVPGIRTARIVAMQLPVETPE